MVDGGFIRDGAVLVDGVLTGRTDWSGTGVDLDAVEDCDDGFDAGGL